MRCAHCCFACTEAGEDMSLEVFKRALEYDSEMITIGGGEPTIHPQFWEFIGLSLANCDYIWMATNGKETETALLLSKLSKLEMFSCVLSRTRYHEKINSKVYETFKKANNLWVSDIFPQKMAKAGRCTWGIEEKCCCPSLFIKPNGDIMGCGCADAIKLGNILTGYNIPTDFQMGECASTKKIKAQDNLMAEKLIRKCFSDTGNKNYGF